MVGEAVQRRDQGLPPASKGLPPTSKALPPASKALPPTSKALPPTSKALPHVFKAGGARRGLESKKKNEGIGLADLREEDKTKVARLINQVILAFRENQRLKELLEGERNSHTAFITKLQQQNHEVAAEVSHLRLKLASMQPASPLPPHKVILQAGRPPTLSPIREAEGSEAETETTRSLAQSSNTEIKRILRERENLSTAFPIAVGSKEKGVFNQSEGTHQHDDNSRMEESQASCAQTNVVESPGKENKDPEFLPRLTGEDGLMASEEDAAVLPKRPPPRPLPDLLTNILHRTKEVTTLPSADRPGSSDQAFSIPDTSSVTNPTLQEQLKPEVPLPLPQLVQPSCSSFSLESVKQPTPNAATSSQGLPDLSTGTSGNHASRIVHGQCSQAGLSNPLSIAGEEGMFYCALDVKKTGNENLDSRSLQPAAAAEGEEAQVDERTERLSASVPSMEEQGLNRITLESHWTPEAIEKRNSFHKIPVLSPRFVQGNGRHADALNRLGSNSFNNESMKPDTRRNLSSSQEHKQIPDSDSEVIFVKSKKSYHRKLRQSPQRASKCIKCSSIFQEVKSGRPQSSKFASTSVVKCSSVDEHGRSICRARENTRCGARITKCKGCTCSVKDKHTFRRCVETSGSSTDQETNVSDSLSESSSRSMARCPNCMTRLKPKSVRPIPPMPRVGKGGIKSCATVKEDRSKPASVVYSVTSEDLNVSTHSSADSPKAGKLSPSFPVKVCGTRTRKIRKKHGSHRDISSAELKVKQRSEPIREVFHVNHEILDVLLQSDGENVHHPKSSCVDRANCRVQTRSFGKSYRNGSKSVAKGHEGSETRDQQRSEANSRIFALNGLMDADGHASGESSPSRKSCEKTREYNIEQQEKQSAESRRTFEVDDLLDRFIQSNAEYAAELIKCSVYFESTVARPTSENSLVTEKATNGSLSSRPPSPNTLVGEEVCLVSHEKVQPRKELFHLDHNSLTSTPPVQCGQYSTALKSRTARPLFNDPVEKREQTNVCVTCPVSPIGQERKMKRSADHGAEKNRRSQTVAPPIVLPNVKNNEASKIDQGGRPKPSVISPISSELLVQSRKKFGVWASENNTCNPPDNPTEDNLMPIFTRVLVSSRRSTPPRETDEAETVKGLTEMFDMSLYDLVNDLEGQRRDYWRRLNNHSMHGKSEIRNRDTDNNRRRKVEVAKKQRASITKAFPLRKQGSARHFR